MDPEIWVAVAAVFVSGGAIGTAGTLLTQWLLRGLRAHPPPELSETRETARLRADLRALMHQVRNMDERLDFQEQLLGGASPTRRPPRRLPEGGAREEAPDEAPVRGEAGDGSGRRGNAEADSTASPPSAEPP